MKISLRAGEKIYMNGAVFSVDRRVSLQLLNDVTFLLEAHVMQAREATTPLRQIYFAIQTMLMEPSAAKELMASVWRMLEAIIRVEKQSSVRMRLVCVADLLRSDRRFEALREVREIYRAEEAAGQPDVEDANMEGASACN